MITNYKSKRFLFVTDPFNLFGYLINRKKTLVPVDRVMAHMCYVYLYTIVPPVDGVKVKVSLVFA